MIAFATEPSQETVHRGDCIGRRKCRGRFCQMRTAYREHEFVLVWDSARRWDALVYGCMCIRHWWERGYLREGERARLFCKFVAKVMCK